MDNLTICCADIGSVKAGKFGWASLRVAPAATESSQTDAHDRSDIQELAAFVADCLVAGEKVALGFECPLWIPVADEPVHLTKGRSNERDRPWSAGAGCGSLATGLTEVAWILERIRRQAVDAKAFLNWRRFQCSQSGLFLWEALVTGGAKAGSHEADALAAVREFRCGLPDQKPQDHSVTPAALTRTRSLIGGALLWAGWSTEIRLLHTPCLVIRA